MARPLNALVKIRIAVMKEFNLTSSNIFVNGLADRAEIAQPVEQGTENPRVRSSTLRLGTT